MQNFFFVIVEGISMDVSSTAQIQKKRIKIKKTLCVLLETLQVRLFCSRNRYISLLNLNGFCFEMRS